VIKKKNIMESGIPPPQDSGAGWKILLCVILLISCILSQVIIYPLSGGFTLTLLHILDEIKLVIEALINIPFAYLIDGKIPIEFMPSGFFDVIGFPFGIGCWNAATNTPLITNTCTRTGDYYTVTVAGNTTINGIGGPSDPWFIGDTLVCTECNGWQRGRNQGALSSSLLDQPNGLAQLGPDGKILPSEIPTGVFAGELNFISTWNANTNTPTIISGMGTNGDLYIVSVSGTTNIDGNNFWTIGSGLVFSSPPGVWLKIGGLQNLQITTTVGNTVLPSEGIKWLNGGGTYIRITPGEFSGKSFNFVPGTLTPLNSNNLHCGPGPSCALASEATWENNDVVDHLLFQQSGGIDSGSPFDVGFPYNHDQKPSMFITRRGPPSVVGTFDGRVRIYFNQYLTPGNCFTTGFASPCLNSPDQGFGFILHFIPRPALRTSYPVNGFATVKREYKQIIHPAATDIRNVYLQCTVTVDQESIQSTNTIKFLCLGDLPIRSFIYNNQFPLYISGYVDYLTEVI